MLEMANQVEAPVTAAESVGAVVFLALFGHILPLFSLFPRFWVLPDLLLLRLETILLSVSDRMRSTSAYLSSFWTPMRRTGDLVRTQLVYGILNKTKDILGRNP